jgi:hypothetical protein
LDREHVGESMLPSMRHYLRFIDLEREYEARGFMRKVRSAPGPGPGILWMCVVDIGAGMVTIAGGSVQIRAWCEGML